MKMKSRIIKSLAFLLLFSFLLYGCQKSPLATSSNAAFESFTNDLFRADVSSTTLGLHYTLKNPDSYDIKTDTITFGSFQTDKTTSLAALENLEASLFSFPYNSLSEKNQLTYDILNDYIQTAKKGTDFALYEEPLNSVTGIQAQLPILLAEYSFSHKTDVEIYLKLLKTLPDYFDSLINFEKEKSREGLFMAPHNAQSIIEQCEAFLSMGEENYLLSTFEERLLNVPDLSDSDRKTFIDQNKKLLTICILPAYETLTTALKSLLDTSENQDGLCHLPKGREYYSHLVLRDTGSKRTVEELEKLIQSQMADDLLSMQTLLAQNQLSAEETTSPFTASPGEMLDDLKVQITKAFPEAAPVKIEVKYVPRALQDYLSPAFYLIPAIDNATENVIYINEGHASSGLNLFTTLAHEGYPGHLYQTTYFSSTNPDPLRSILNFEGYTEGWATYAEMCSYSLSPLKKEVSSLLQKNSSLTLGMYSTLDIGIHYHGWDYKKVSQYVKNYGITEEETIRDIYELIIATPGNYLKYYVGYVEFLELKKKMIEKQGSSFSQKDFHQKILEIGPAPFSILEKYMLS